ncbi:unnamed protein product [Malus baccata var. baccata]
MVKYGCGREWWLISGVNEIKSKASRIKETNHNFKGKGKGYANQERPLSLARQGRGKSKEVRQRYPHMLFYGHPGTGKPTTALAITHQLFGFASCPLNYLFEIPKSVFISELYKSRVLELNASDDRGSMIIEPLALRCAKFRFKPLSEDIMISRIVHIVQEEGLNLDPEVLSTLSSTSQGDLNRALTFLQLNETVLELTSVSGVVPKEVVGAFFSACQGDNFDLANKEVNNVIAEGYPVSNAFTDDILDEQKARICKKLGEPDKCLVDVSDEYLQLFDVASSTMRAVCNVQEDFFQEC